MLKIVFPASPDLGYPRGDNVKAGGISLNGGSAGEESSTLPNSACDSSQESGDQSGKISYSVSYFSWSVSDESSEEECDTITLRLDRMKIRKSSRERNDARSLVVASTSTTS